jgi:hypothetical protein
MHAQLRDETLRRLERRRQMELKIAEAEAEVGRQEAERRRRQDEERWYRLMRMREAERFKLQAKAAERKQQQALALLHDLSRRELVAARRAVAAVALQSAVRRLLARAAARDRQDNQLQLHFCAHQACWVARTRAAASPEGGKAEAEGARCADAISFRLSEV